MTKNNIVMKIYNISTRTDASFHDIKLRYFNPEKSLRKYCGMLMFVSLNITPLRDNFLDTVLKNVHSFF